MDALVPPSAPLFSAGSWTPRWNKRLQAAIKRQNSFAVRSPEVRVTECWKAGTHVGWKIQVAGRQTVTIFETILGRQARAHRQVEFLNDPQFTGYRYTDGLSPEDVSLECDNLLDDPVQVVSLASPTFLFDLQLGLDWLNWNGKWSALATRNSRHAHASGTGKPLPGSMAPPRRKVIWHDRAQTKHHPFFGQRHIGFHPIFPITSIRVEQALIVWKLSQLDAQSRNQGQGPLLDSEVLTTLNRIISRDRYNFNDTDTFHRLMLWPRQLHGAVPLLLEHVDPDLLTCLLSPIAKQQLVFEINYWKSHVRGVLLTALHSRLRVIDPMELTERLERKGIPRELIQMWQRNSDTAEVQALMEKHIGTILPKWMETDPFFTLEAAVERFLDQEGKIIRRCLENARRLLQSKQYSYAVYSESYFHLFARFAQVCRDQIRSRKAAARSKVPRPKPQARSLPAWFFLVALSPGEKAVHLKRLSNEKLRRLLRRYGEAWERLDVLPPAKYCTSSQKREERAAEKAFRRAKTTLGNHLRSVAKLRALARPLGTPTKEEDKDDVQAIIDEAQGQISEERRFYSDQSDSAASS